VSASKEKGVPNSYPTPLYSLRSARERKKIAREKALLITLCKFVASTFLFGLAGVIVFISLLAIVEIVRTLIVTSSLWLATLAMILCFGLVAQVLLFSYKRFR
jgi:hypothetical protein